MFRILWALLIAMLLVGSVFARSGDEPNSVTDFSSANAITEPAELIGPATAFRINGVGDPNLIPPAPRRDLGESTEIGRTFYDYQHNGTIGKMICVDSEGGIHITWMRSEDAMQVRRRMAFNWWDPDAEEWLEEPDGGIVVDQSERAGYGHMALLPEDQRSVVFYHARPEDAGPEEFYPTMSVDFGWGIGAFEASYAPRWPNIMTVWPKGALDQNNFAHMLATENSDPDQNWQRIAYWRGEATDEDFLEWDWTDPPINVDTTGCISSIVSASTTSNMVVMAWHHNRIGSQRGPWDQYGGAWQRNNDIRYVILPDGEEYDPDEHEILSVTKIIPPDPDAWDDENPPTSDDRDPFNENAADEAYGDIWRPYTDLDMQIDPWGDDGIYATFAACGFWERPFLDVDDSPIDGMTGEHDAIWFYNAQEDTLTWLANGWYFNRTNNGGSWHSRCGAWRMNADRPSIAFDPDNEGTIFVTWVSFPQICILNPRYNDDPENEIPFLYDDFEFATDTSSAGYSNAEVMVSVSTDYGITWLEPVNITETRWEEDEAPEPGECQSEAWQSVSVQVFDGALHLMYVRDTDAGGIAQEEGTATNSSVYYHNVPIEELNIDDLEPVEIPFEGFMFHNYPQARPMISDVLRDPGVPTPQDEVTVTATITAGGEDVEITGAVLVYFLDEDLGDSSVVEMEHIGDDVYSATIPDQNDGRVVWYRLRATNDIQSFTNAPRGWFYSYTVRTDGELSIADVQYRPEDWTTDYSPYRGYEVTVTGVVTTPSTFNEEYGAYAIQDARLFWSGIYVRGIEQDLVPGQEISVTGMVMERDPDDLVKWQYETYIQLSDNGLEEVGDTDVPVPMIVEVNELRYSEHAEHLEGLLIQTEMMITVDDLADLEDDVALGYYPIVDDNVDEGYRGWMTGIGMTEDDLQDIEYADFAMGTTISRLTGVFTENYGHYAITPRDLDDFGTVSVDEVNPSPYTFSLDPAYPNPFNGLTRVGFELSQAGWARLALYDLNGRLVLDLVEGDLGVGHYDCTVDASSFATGVYILRLETNTASVSQKLVLMK